MALRVFPDEHGQIAGQLPCSGRDDVVPGMIAAIETWAMLIKRLYKIDPLACTPLTRQYLLIL